MQNISTPQKLPAWIPPVLKLSGLICVTAGVWHIISSGTFLSFLNIAMPSYRPYMSWVGIMMAVLGVVSIAISYNPLQSTNIIVILFFAKFIISVKLLFNIFYQEISFNFMMVVIVIDTLWIPVFGVIIYKLMQINRDRQKNSATNENAGRVLSEMYTQDGHTLLEITSEKPVLVIFLRHLRCIYTSEVFDRIKKQYDQITAQGVETVFVHMSSEIVAMNEFKKLGADRFIRVSDPNQELYALSGMNAGSIRQFLCLRFLVSGFNYFRINKKIRYLWGDPVQMNGYAIIFHDRILFKKTMKKIGEAIEYVETIHQLSDEIAQMQQSDKSKKKSVEGKILYADFNSKKKPCPSIPLDE